jgi:glycerate dehydrogenase
MKIVITDGYTLNPGDLSWKAFDQLGEVIYYDRSSPSETPGRCREAGVIITNKTPITEEIITSATQLNVIAVTATGYNVVDIAAAKKKNVPVCNVPVYGTDSVAQHTFALLLELTNQVGRHAESVRAGDWARSLDWCYAKTPILELRDKTIGIVGFGRIGHQVGNLANAFGMKVIYYNRRELPDPNKVESLEELFAQSDIISVHCPLTNENNGFIDKRLLSTAKPGAFLINTSRGQLINETDLANALQKGVLAGAALDVLSKEPPPADHPLLGLSNCLITPHMAWLSQEARKRIMETTLENVRLALAGTPRNVVPSL